MIETDFPTLTVREECARRLEEDGFDAIQRFGEMGDWEIHTYVTPGDRHADSAALWVLLADLPVRAHPLREFGDHYVVEPV